MCVLVVVEFVKKTLSVGRHEGVAELWRRFLFRFFRLNCFLVYFVDLTKHTPCFKQPVGVVIKEVGVSELAQIIKCDIKYPSEFYRKQSNKNERCFVAIISGAVATIVWTSSSPSSGFINVRDGIVELNHIYCLSRFRSQNLCTAVLTFACDQLRLEGHDKLVTATHSENIALIKSITKCGFQYSGHIVKRWGILKWPVAVDVST